MLVEGVGEKTSVSEEGRGRRGVGGMMRGDARSAVGAVVETPLSGEEGRRAALVNAVAAELATVDAGLVGGGRI